MQAHNWIKTTYKEKNLEIIKPTMDNVKMTQLLTRCVSNGVPVMLEDAGENFEQIIQSILAKQIEKRGATYQIRLGDAPIEYSHDFLFFVTTKLAKPHYSPEICVKVNMLNFMVTEEGLLDQMQNIIVEIEDKPKFERNNANIATKASNEKIVEEL
mmetsp:Transcript_113299/g.156551  ORF Transcript_113299/g.156551 Transcript_113299/m.156551 type:complete len:156 (-) Transcript_113299:2094-2561(-)